jgi:hypothetical protein
MSITSKYLSMRRHLLFPTVADIEWRHEELVARIIEIEKRVNPVVLMGGNPSNESQELIRKFFRKLEVYDVAGYNKIRIGSAGDGGYIQVDDFNGIDYALSLGINDNDDWDLDIAQKGIPVQQFDHSIDAAPSNHPLLSFYKKKITSNTNADEISLNNLIQEIKYNGKPNILLKMDIEGYEWEVLESCDDELLNRITQITCEFHGFSRLLETGFYSRAAKIIEKINQYFSVVHVHGNNAAPLCNIANIAVPDVLEISFANRSLYNFEPYHGLLPTKLDAANNEDYPDIFLGSFKF